MKQKDIALIAVIVFISAMASFLISKTFIKPSSDQQQVEVVQAINGSFSEPNKAYFNDKSFDPVKIIKIGDNTNPDPFGGATGQ